MTPIFLTKSLNFRQKYSSLTPFLRQVVLCLTSHNSTSENIGGTDAWAVPHLNFLGEDRTSAPLSLRPCERVFHVPIIYTYNLDNTARISFGYSKTGH